MVWIEVGKQVSVTCLIPIQDNISLHGISLKLKMLYINLSIANPDTLHELLKMSETISYKRYM